MMLPPIKGAITKLLSLKPKPQSSNKILMVESELLGLVTTALLDRKAS